MKKKVLMLTLAAACILFSLGGCTKTPEEKVNLTVVAAKMANQPAPSLELMQTGLEQAAQTGGRVFLIRPHGSPDLAETISFPEQDALMLPSQLQRIVGEQVASVTGVASQVTATEAECDLLGGLRLAGRTAQPADGERNELVILNSGLSTVAPLDLSQCLLENLDIQATVSRLQAEFALADLSGYDSVKFYQLGDAAAPQEELSPAGRQKLRELWEAILVASGAKEVSFPDDPPTSSQPSEDLPSVKTISVLKPSNAVQGAALDVSFDEQAVGFAPDRADFLDPEAAWQALVPTAQALAADPSQKALVVGQTAPSDGEDSPSPSLEIADPTPQELAENLERHLAVFAFVKELSKLEIHDYNRMFFSNLLLHPLHPQAGVACSVPGGEDYAKILSEQQEALYASVFHLEYLQFVGWQKDGADADPADMQVLCFGVALRELLDKTIAAYRKLSEPAVSYRRKKHFLPLLKEAAKVAFDGS